ncbi:hypothetical protein HELRODRAFT_168385 [Helobdella robusta]|uniref:BTB domain-containing protein n=1 Tax=Helobdella robusta TaxID=6412 RepID=T1F0I7_HELRO|nr:hypothetical protein HELRODRAFT_168385 [Helobdella robusta]ESO09403.1 hypothetical protein HELRODRAFT_168385 [Helobdella robusta]
MKKYVSAKYQHKVLRNLYKNFENGSFCDLTIVCKDASFKVHKLVLASSCDFFSSMFQFNFNENKSNTIDLSHSKASIIRAVIKFVYTGSVKLTEDNVQDLLIVADQYGLSDLFKICTKFLEKNIYASNVIGMHMLAEQLNCINLKNHSFKYMKNNFSDVVKSDEFLSMPLNLFINYISAPDLSICTEIEVFEAGLAWICHDLKERESSAEEVMKTMRISVLPYPVVNDKLQFCSSIIVKNYLGKVISEMLNGDYGKSICRSNRLMIECPINRLSASPRIYFMELIYSPIRCNRSSSMMYYDVRRNEMKTIPLIKQQSDDTEQLIAAVDRRIYFFGGFGNLKTIEMLDTYENQHKTLGPWPRRRSFGAACSVGNEIYLIGGLHETDNFHSDIDIFNTWTKKWRVLPFPREYTSTQHLGVVYWKVFIEIKGLIYIIGGENGEQEAVSQCLIFNPITEKFDDMPNLLTPRSRFGISCYKDHIYVAGGFDHDSNILCTIERYFIERGHWEKVNSLNVSRYMPTMVTVLDKLYILGGNTSLSYSSSAIFEVYDPQKNKCSKIEPLLPLLMHPCAIAI